MTKYLGFQYRVTCGTAVTRIRKWHCVDAINVRPCSC